jgi:hypothetical protein
VVAAPKLLQDELNRLLPPIGAPLTELVANAHQQQSFQFSNDGVSNSVVEELPTIRIDDDYHGWLLAQASLLRSERRDSLDGSNLAEELEAMAAAQRREIKKHLKKLLAHLLKFKAQPDELNRYHSWRKSIREAREEIIDMIEDSPGIFQGKRDEFLAISYQRACVDAGEDTGLAVEAFPANCPWSFDQIMDADFFPGMIQKI